MRKFLAIFVSSFLILIGATTTVAQAKYFETIKTDVYGTVADWSVEVKPFEFQIPSKSLYPGCSYSFKVSIANNGEVPVTVAANIVDIPSFLDVKIKGCKKLNPGEENEFTVDVSIPETESIDIAGNSINFSINFLFEQDI